MKKRRKRKKQRAERKDQERRWPTISKKGEEERQSEAFPFRGSLVVRSFPLPGALRPRRPLKSRGQPHSRPYRIHTNSLLPKDKPVAVLRWSHPSRHRPLGSPEYRVSKNLKQTTFLPILLQRRARTPGAEDAASATKQKH